jgi:hypothetical protein
MSRWLELAASMQADDEPRANSVTSANMQPNGTNDANGTAPLPADVLTGLRRLRTMAAPRITRLEVWPQIVADAQQLVDDGWAQQALALGWHELELFGVGAKSSADFEGLAVWLAGRRLILIDDRSAIAADGDGRSYFNRPPNFDPSGAAYLWEFGRK